MTEEKELKPALTVRGFIEKHQKQLTNDNLDKEIGLTVEEFLHLYNVLSLNDMVLKHTVYAFFDSLPNDRKSKHRQLLGLVAENQKNIEHIFVKVLERLNKK